MNAAIVGAGPAGAAFAYLCAERGIDVTLIEREPDFDRTFRGEGLMPSGVHALNEMGLSELLDDLPTRSLQGWDVAIDGREILSIPEPADNAVRIIPQAQFLEAIVERCLAHKNFRFVPGTIARDLIEEDHRIRGLVLKSENAIEELRADLVVGCDGRASAIRKHASLDLTRLPESYHVLWFSLPAPERLRETSRMMMMVTSGQAGACYTSWDNDLRYALMRPKAESETTRADANWTEELAALAPGWLADHIRAVAGDIPEPVRLNVMVGYCKHWYRPGCLLLGDAAHPMSPVRAQGINHALRDAIVAANHLVPILRTESDPETLDGAAPAIERERLPEIRRAQTLQHRDTQGINRPYTPAILALAKTLGPILGKYTWAQNAWLNQQHDLRHGILDVRLTV